MFRVGVTVVLAVAILSGCGKRETDAERRRADGSDNGRAANDTAKSQIDGLVKAIDSFHQAVGRFPTTLSQLHGLVEHPCKVIEKRVVEVKSEKALRFQPKVKIEYEVGGVTYSSPKTYDIDHSTRSTLDEAQAAIDGFREGQTYPCWCDPADPSTAVLVEPLMPDPWSHPFHYRSPGVHNPDGFDLWAVGPDGKEIGNWK